MLKVKSILDGVSSLKEVSFTLKHPETVMEFPAAFIAAGGGPRTTADTGYYHFNHEMEIEVYLMVQEATTDKLWEELEDLIKTVLDAIEAGYLAARDSVGYDIYVSNVDTDRGSLAFGEVRCAVAVLTVTALLPAKDA